MLARYTKRIRVPIRRFRSRGNHPVIRSLASPGSRESVLGGHNGGVDRVIRQVFGPMTVEDELVLGGRVQDLLEDDAVRKAYLG